MFVANDPVEALFAVLNFIDHAEIGIGGTADSVKETGRVDFRLFDSFGDFHFLFAGQEGHLPHLFEVHPNGVVEHITTSALFFALFFFHPSLEILYLVGANDLDFHTLKQCGDLFNILDDHQIFRKSLLDIVIREKSVIGGERDQLFDFFVTLFTRHDGNGSFLSRQFDRRFRLFGGSLL